MGNITGNAVEGKNYLKTRLFLVDELRKLLAHSSLIIDAPRRFGKTSVLKEFHRQEKRSGSFHLLYFELEGTESLEDFCRLFCKELLTLYKTRNALKKLQTMGSDFLTTFSTLTGLGLGKRLAGLESLKLPIIMDEKDARVLIRSLLSPLKIKIDKEGMNFLLSKIVHGPPYYGQVLITDLSKRPKTGG